MEPPGPDRTAGSSEDSARPCGSIPAPGCSVEEADWAVVVVVSRGDRWE